MGASQRKPVINYDNHEQPRRTQELHADTEQDSVRTVRSEATHNAYAAIYGHRSTYAPNVVRRLQGKA